MQIHGDDMVTASRLEHVGHELGCNGSTRLVLFILAGIGKVGKHSGDAAGRSRLAGVDHDQKLHEGIIDVAWGCRLQDEDCKVRSGRASWPRHFWGHTVFVSHRLANGHRGLLVGVLEHQDLGEFDAESASPSASPPGSKVRSIVKNVPAGDKVGELGVAVASEQLDAVGRHGCSGVGSKVGYRSSGVVRDGSWLTWWREG